MGSKIELKGKFTTFALSLLVLGCAPGCGGDLSNGYPGYQGQRFVADGGACGYGQGGGYACECTDRAYVVAVEMALGSSGGLTNLQTEILPASQMSPTASVSPPAPGTPSADVYWVATLAGSDGAILATTVVDLPSGVVDGGDGGGHGGYGGRSGQTGGSDLSFAVALVPRTESISIASWSTGQVVVDVDLLDRIQVLCTDQPCLSVCLSASPGGADGGNGVPADGGGRAVDGAASRMVDSGAPRGVDGGAPVDGGRVVVDAGLSQTRPLDGSVVDVRSGLSTGDGAGEL
jgi:hypothetical protein